MKFTIFGSGGAGGFFGAHLARSGADVSFVARGDHFRAMASGGLRLRSDGGELTIHPVRVSTRPQDIGETDVVLLGVKAWQVVEAAQAMGPLMGPQTVVIPLQNGVEAVAELNSVLGSAHVLAGTCGVISWISAPGEITSIGTSNFLRFGEQDNARSQRVLNILERLRGAGINAEVPNDIQVAIWSKFLVVTAIGGVGAATGLTVGQILSVPSTRGILEQCMLEVKATAAAHGIALDEDVVPRMMRYLESLDPGSTTSLQRDISAGKTSELGYWTGAVLRLADAHTIAVPANRMIHNTVQARIE